MPNESEWGINTFIINLERRADRLSNIKRQLQTAGIEEYKVISGFDNKILNLQDASDATLRFGRGFIGVYLSHLAIFKMALALGFKEIMVLEDDVILADDFKRAWGNVKVNLPDGWEMVYLHHGKSNIEHFPSYREEVNTHIFRAGYIGSFAGYILNENGLKKIYGILNNVIEDHIDVTLARYNTFSDDLKAYCIVPSLVEIDTNLGTDNL